MNGFAQGANLMACAVGIALFVAGLAIPSHGLAACGFILTVLGLIEPAAAIRKHLFRRKKK